jgi:hypothetical protein
MTRRHDPAWVWMIGAFLGAVALAVAVLADYGTGPDGIGQAVRYTARWSFLFFWLSYAGGALASLFRPAFAGLARRARPLGLAFASALQVHIGLVVWLGVVVGQIPLGGGLLWFFLAALFCSYLLALLSFGVGARNLGRLWRPLLFLATTYILIAFGRDFVLGAVDQHIRYLPYAAEYVPFALLSVIAIPLRLAAFVRLRFGLRSARPAAELDSGASEMPLTTTEVPTTEVTTTEVQTTEVPTFFGPSDSPLFGVVHLPADNEIRGGVLICGSLGKEGMDGVRLYRTLAEELARRGFVVLRFDYLGLGDSAYSQVRDDAVANWVASVGHALDYLTLIGAESVTAIGIRAGCLILDEYLAQSHPVNRVVYLDPPGTGRRYLREHTSLFRLSVGEGTLTPGEVSIIGGQLSDHAAAEFAALRMGGNPISAHGVDNVLVVGRPAETDKRVLALASAEGVDSIVASGLPECARPREFLVPVPYTAVDSIVEWIDGNGPTQTHCAVPQYLTTMTMPAEGPDGVDVVESIERIEPNGLFAIRTLPRRRIPAPAKTVLFFVTAKDVHVGPTREWVESSRRIAAAGSQAVRWDPAGLNYSAHISRDPWRSAYTKADLADSIAAARHACQDAGELELVGICSGGWYAAHVARVVGAQSVILVNPRPWNWRITPTILGQWNFRKRALRADAGIDTLGGPAEGTGSRTQRLKTLLNSPREPMKSVIHSHLPRHLLRALGWVGLLWLPEDVLPTLAHSGIDVTVVLGPEDTEEFTARGGRAVLDRLRRASQAPRLIPAPIGDHSAFHPAMLAAIRDAVLPVAGVSPSENILVSEITVSPNPLATNRSHLATGPGTVTVSAGYTGGSERDHYHGGGRA